ncbi:MAG: extradiol ring-cleavage dioxygenase [Chloroflexi bacterium]|nr:extradiol ring-cleavage dioxygenase [Chloroflexota bacterium]
MAEIMGGGLHEYPYMRFSPEKIAERFEASLQSPNVTDELRDSKNWPAAMREEYGNDHGLSAARAHQEQSAAAFRKLRQAIDDFNPDVVLIWSKEQMENFGEDCMPPFCVYAYEDMDIQPHHRFASMCPTIWGEDENTKVPIKGARLMGKYLTTKLIGHGFDMPYAYKPLHETTLAHTFEGLITHLDWDRKGFPYPILPFYVNAYGHRHLTGKGESRDGELDPPAPSPARCFELGRTTAQILRDSPWRVAIIAGSSWSHATVNPKNGYLHPDVEADRVLVKHLEQSDYHAWRDLNLGTLVHSGQQEVLSWVALAGAMEELKLHPTFVDVTETWIFNSTKVTAIFH